MPGSGVALDMRPRSKLKLERPPSFDWMVNAVPGNAHRTPMAPAGTVDLWRTRGPAERRFDFGFGGDRAGIEPTDLWRRRRRDARESGRDRVQVLIPKSQEGRCRAIHPRGQRGHDDGVILGEHVAIAAIAAVEALREGRIGQQFADMRRQSQVLVVVRDRGAGLREHVIANLGRSAVLGEGDLDSAHHPGVALDRTDLDGGDRR